MKTKRGKDRESCFARVHHLYIGLRLEWKNTIIPPSLIHHINTNTLPQAGAYISKRPNLEHIKGKLVMRSSGKQ